MNEKIKIITNLHSQSDNTDDECPRIAKLLEVF